MNLEFFTVSEEEYSKSLFATLIESPNKNRAFAILLKDKSQYRLAWQSDLMTPQIVELNESYIAIGIDQYFCVVDCVRNDIKVKIPLAYNFVETKILNNSLYVITELEIQKLNVNTLVVESIFQLPDLFEEIGIKGSKIEVKCMGDIEILIR